MKTVKRNEFISFHSIVFIIWANIKRETVRNASVFKFIEHDKWIFRRTPRRKLVFSSSDDEIDNSPQSISSGKINDQSFHWWIVHIFLFLVHVLRQIHQDDQWVFSSFIFFSSSFDVEGDEVDCMNIQQSTLWFRKESLHLIYDWQFDGTRLEKVFIRPLTFPSCFFFFLM